jgi:hypothetical protein
MYEIFRIHWRIYFQHSTEHTNKNGNGYKKDSNLAHFYDLFIEIIITQKKSMPKKVLIQLGIKFNFPLIFHQLFRFRQPCLCFPLHWSWNLTSNLEQAFENRTQIAWHTGETHWNVSQIYIRLIRAAIVLRHGYVYRYVCLCRDSLFSLSFSCQAYCFDGALVVRSLSGFVFFCCWFSLLGKFMAPCQKLKYIRME